MSIPTKQCPRCRKPISADSQFCNYCGAKVVGTSSAQQPPVPPSTKHSKPAHAAPPAAENIVWRPYKDTWNGFTLERPSGWEVRVTHDSISICQDQAGLVNAFIRPIQLEQPASAAALAQRISDALRASNPTFTAWQMNPEDVTFVEMQRKEDQALLRIRFSEDGQELVGVLTVMVEGKSALVSGFQAPLARIQPFKPIFEKILASFQPIPRLARSAFVEEAEQAFTANTPEGWQAQGTLLRTPDAGIIFQFRAASPDGTLSAEVPGRYYLFQEAPKGLLAKMVPQRYQTHDYLSAAAFAEQMLAPEMRQRHPDLQVERIVNRSDLITSQVADSLRYGENVQAKNLSIAMLQCTYTDKGAAYRQRTSIVVQRWAVTRVWRASIGSIVRAPQEQFAQHAATLEGIAESVRPQMQWVQAQQQKKRQEAQQAAKQIAGFVQQAVQLENARQQQHQAQQAHRPMQPQMPMQMPWESGIGMGMPQIGMGVPSPGTPGVSPQEQLAMQQAWQQAQLQQLQIQRNAHQNIFDMQQAGFQRRMNMQEKQQYQFDNAIRGYQDMRNPFSGNQYNVPIGYNNYWVNGLDQVVGSNLADSPGGNFQRLDPIE